MQSHLIIMEVLDNVYLLSGGVAIITGIVIFIGKFIFERAADKLRIKWSREEEEKLELLRAEITREHSIFTAILNSYSSIHKLSQSERIEAVEILWENTLKLRNLISFPGVFFDSLLEKEYNTIYNNKRVMNGLNSLSSDSLFDEAPAMFHNVEKYRPFHGEPLWNLFHLHYILCFRVVLKLIEGRDEKNITSWDNDEYIRFIIDRLFTDDDRKSIPTPPKNMNPLMPTIDLMERKILFAMFKIISGESVAESDLSKAKELQAVLKEVTPKLSF